jgi:hypothetical protein
MASKLDKYLVAIDKAAKHKPANFGFMSDYGEGLGIELNPAGVATFNFYEMDDDPENSKSVLVQQAHLPVSVLTELHIWLCNIMEE